MRWFLVFMLLSLPAVAEQPDQWQYEESLEVPPGPIPRDRCIRALYESAELKEERGARFWEQWHPPVSDRTAHWLEWHRQHGNLSLVFCDQDSL
ncbi:MAG: hypothetical protein RJS97_02475 [Parvibaculaceae bacterium]